MEMTYKEITAHMNNNGTDILTMLGPNLMDANMMTQMVTGHVLLDWQKTSLECKTDQAKRCSAFIDIVKSGSPKIYYKLIKVLEENNLSNLVELLVPTDQKPAKRQPAAMAKPIPVQPRAGVSDEPDEPDHSGAGAAGSSRDLANVMELLASDKYKWIAVNFAKLQYHSTHAPVPRPSNVAIVDVLLNPEHVDVKLDDIKDFTHSLPLDIRDIQYLKDKEVDTKKYLENPHGTISACIIQKYAPGTRVVGYNVARYMYSNKNKTWEWSLDNTAINEALEDIENDDDIEFVNMSFGGTDDIPAFSEVLKRLSKKKVLIAAASNDGWTEPNTIDFPARMDEVIAVGSCTRGGREADHCPQGPELDFLMPGIDITIKNWKEKNGTSYATPHLVAAAGLILKAIEAVLGPEKRKEFTTTAHMKALLIRACEGNDPHSKERGYGLPHLNLIDVEFLEQYAEAVKGKDDKGKGKGKAECTLLDY